MSEINRVFLGYPFPDQVRLALEQFMQALPKGKRISWVDPGNMHLTLKFLGDFPVDRVGELTAAVKDAIVGRPILEYRLERTGAFPGFQRPRILWIGLKGDAASIANLAGRVDVACHAFGFPTEQRPFSPHVTLARVKETDGNAEVFEAFRRARICTEAFMVDRVVIFRSELGPQGPVYTHLADIPL